MPGTKGNKNAEKKVNWKLVDGMLEINCTGEEIASVLGISYDTIARHCKKEKGLSFADYLKNGNEKFKRSLKRLQFESAKKGNVTMQIWLGKQYLGQTDKQEISQGSEVTVTYKDMKIE